MFAGRPSSGPARCASTVHANKRPAWRSPGLGNWRSATPTFYVSGHPWLPDGGYRRRITGYADGSRARLADARRDEPDAVGGRDAPPAGHGGLVDRLETLERRLAELSRSSSTGAVCQIRLASDTAIAPATDTVLTAWPQTAEVDTAGMWRHVANGQSYIQLPHAGRWWVHFHSQWAAAPAGYGLQQPIRPERSGRQGALQRHQHR